MLEAAREVANPIAFAILIIIVVFLPLFSLTGLEGKLFKPMALTITFAMAGSLLLSLTLVPVLAALILKPKEEKDTWLVRGAKRLYLPLLDWALDRKKTVIGAAVALLVGALALFPLLGKEFMPHAAGGRDHVPRRRHPVDVARRVDPRVANVMDASLRKKYPQVRSVLATIGRAEKGETADVNYMEVLLDLKPQDEWPTKQSFPALGREMQEYLEEEVQTAVFGATQPIQMRVEELISGVRATLALKVYGEDLDTLEHLSAQLKAVIGGVPGVADLSAEANKGKPQMVIKVDRAAAARYGLNADDILEVVQAGIGGETVSTLIEGTRRFDIAVRLADEFRNSPSAIAPSRSAPPRARWCRSRRWRASSSPRATPSFAARRCSATPCCRWTCRAATSTASCRTPTRPSRPRSSCPTGYWVEWGGAFENQQRAMARLGAILFT